MKKSSIIIISLLTLAVGLILTFVLISRQYRPKYRWEPNFMARNDQPYGMQIGHDLLKAHFGKKFKKVNHPLQGQLNEEVSNALYVLIGSRAFYDSLGFESMCNFVSKGNTVFLAIQEIPYNLSVLHHQFADSAARMEYLVDSVVLPQFLGDTSLAYKFHFQYLKKKQSYHWAYFDSLEINNAYSYNQTEALATVDSSRVNYIRLPYGEGSFLIHSNPILFTNYYLADESGLEYLEKILAHAGPVDLLFWDERSKLPAFGKIGRGGLGDNPLKYVMENRSLRITWYLLLAMSTLLLVFYARRRQAPIPVIKENKNSSVEYAKAVGILHYQKSHHKLLAKDLMQLFKSFIKQKYDISPSIEEEKQIRLLTLKSGVEEDTIRSIYKHYVAVKFNPQADKQDTIAFHSILENFYKNCK